MQPDNEIVPENNTGIPPQVDPTDVPTDLPVATPADPLSTPPPAPLNPTPSADVYTEPPMAPAPFEPAPPAEGYSEPPMSAPVEPASFQEPVQNVQTPVFDEQPQPQPQPQQEPVQTPPPVTEQPQSTGFMGKIKSVFGKK